MSSLYTADYSINNSISNIDVSSANISEYITNINLVYTTLTKRHAPRTRTININHPCITTGKTKTPFVANTISYNTLSSQEPCLAKSGNLKKIKLSFLSINVY